MWQWAKRGLAGGRLAPAVVEFLKPPEMLRDGDVKVLEKPVELQVESEEDL